MNNLIISWCLKKWFYHEFNGNLQFVYMLYFGFQKLEIYQLLKELVKDIYKLSSSFPSDEKYALVQQINKAAVSVTSNIAEGTSRNGYQEKIPFINISYSSLMEIVCQTEIAFEYLKKDVFEKISKKAKKLSVKMSNYIASIIKSNI